MSDKPQASALLSVRELQCWYPVRRGFFSRAVEFKKAVDGVTFELRHGETLGLIGESGCGKTTLSRAILGLLKPRSGEILLDGTPIASAANARRVQVVFQDPQAALNPRHMILDLLTEAAVFHHLIPSNEREALALRLLADVGLSGDILHRFPHALSGGQRQRVCIARALALDPQLVICDEAVSALDLSVRAQVLNLLMELKAKRGLSYLFITHDITVIEHIADRVLVMKDGQIVESGEVGAVVSNPQHPYTATLIAAVPRIA